MIIKNIFKEFNLDVNKYLSFGWGLSENQLNILGSLIINNNFSNIIEFGHGFSSVFITDLLKKINKSVYIESFENDSTFIKQIDYPTYDLKIRNLVECTDENYNLMFKYKKIYKEKLYKRQTPPECTQKNCFYEIESTDIQQENYDLCILDGPHGNGRNLSYLYLKNKMKKNSYFFIDDFNHYDFLEKCQELFNIEVIHREIGEKNFIIARIK